MPRSIAKVVLPPYTPSYDDLYLQALKIHSDYVIKAKQIGGLKIESGAIINEMKEAAEHYRELTWKEAVR